MYQCVTASLQAESNLHASLFALQLVERFVTQEGRWPRSWTELEAVKMPDDTSGRQWPADSVQMQRRIVIDFEADPRGYGRQDRLKFTAIRPKGPFFEYRDYGSVDSLQAAIRKSVAEKMPVPTSSPAN